MSLPSPCLVTQHSHWKHCCSIPVSLLFTVERKAYLGKRKAADVRFPLIYWGEKKKAKLSNLVLWMREVAVLYLSKILNNKAECFVSVGKELGAFGELNVLLSKFVPNFCFSDIC